MANDTDDFLALNEDLWDKRVRAHLEAGLYPSDEVEAGTYTVGEPDRSEIGDIDGKRLLHLQCNAGADTLFWARQGAVVVGIDFSTEAITEARRLADVTGIRAQFLRSDVYDLPALELGDFDVVYTSMGVLWWLPDLGEWARLIATHLRAGGFFYIHEIHPFAMALRDDGDHFVVATDYFGSREPLMFESSGTYYEADDDFAADTATECGWVHPLGEVVTSLAGAGLRIDFVREHPFTNYRMLPSLVRDESGVWVPRAGRPELPLTFSLLARREP